MGTAPDPNLEALKRNFDEALATECRIHEEAQETNPRDLGLIRKWLDAMTATNRASRQFLEYLSKRN